MASRDDYFEVQLGVVAADPAGHGRSAGSHRAVPGRLGPGCSVVIASTSLPADLAGFTGGGLSDAVPNTFSSTPTDSPGRIAAAARGIDVGATPSQGSGIPDYIVQLAMSGKTIQAIKEFRSFSGMSLKEAKTIIEQVAVRGY